MSCSISSPTSSKIEFNDSAQISRAHSEAPLVEQNRQVTSAGVAVLASGGGAISPSGWEAASEGEVPLAIMVGMMNLMDSLVVSRWLFCVLSLRHTSQVETPLANIGLYTLDNK